MGSDGSSSEGDAGLAGSIARITLRPLGTPLPLGFIGLAVATVLVSALELGWLEPQEGRMVALALIAFTVPTQLISSIFGFLSRDTVAGTGMAILAGTWLAVALVKLTSPPGAVSDVLGLLLLVAAVGMVGPASAAALGKLAPALVLAVTVMRFTVTALHQLTGSSGWEDAAGVVGLVLAGLALYCALALEIEDTARRTVLPLGRRGLGKASIDGNLQDQVRRVEREAGVREQL